MAATQIAAVDSLQPTIAITTLPIQSPVDDTVVPLFMKASLTRCEDEPIHVPGAIQDYGCMVVVQEQEDGTLALLQVSENCHSILGYTPLKLLSLASFYDCLDDEQADLLNDNLDYLANSPESLRAYGPHVFLLSGSGQAGERWSCWCAAHEMGTETQAEDSLLSIILEFEPVTNTNILEGRSSSPHDKIPGHPSEGMLHRPYVPTEEQLLDSSEKKSKPLRALAGRRAQGGKRRRRGYNADGNIVLATDLDEKKLKGWSDTASGIHSNVQMGELLGQVNEQFSNQMTLSALFKTVVGVMLDITSYTRAAVYKFDKDWSGKVVAELVDINVTHDLFQGLHFPAGDIPKQARDLYTVNKVRILFDRDATTSKMVSRPNKPQQISQPVDMTYSFLRAMSPYHVLFVGRIGVRSSMSLSITVNNELWGLILLHHYGDAGKRVSFPMRMLCLQVGESITRNIERLSKSSEMTIHDLVSSTMVAPDPTVHFLNHADELLNLFQATYGVVVIKVDVRYLGVPQWLQECSDACNYIRTHKSSTIISTNDVAAELPAFNVGAEPTLTQRAMIVPLSTDGDDFLAIFRKVTVQTKDWAGQPSSEDHKFMQVRESFSSWSDTTIEQSAKWETDKREAASMLKLLMCKEDPHV